MTEPTLVKEDFDLIDWQEIIENSEHRDCLHYSVLLSRKAREVEAEGPSKAFEVLKLLASVTACRLRSGSNDEPLGRDAPFFG